MELTATILHSDGSVTTATRMAEDAKITDAAVTIGTELRREDATVSAVKFAELGDLYVWEGHATDEHLCAIRDARSAGRW